MKSDMFIPSLYPRCSIWMIAGEGGYYSGIGLMLMPGGKGV